MARGTVTEYFDKGWCVSADGGEVEVDCWEAIKWGISEQEFAELGKSCNGKRYEHEFVYGETDRKTVYDTYFKNKEDAETFLKELRTASKRKAAKLMERNYNC